MLASVDCSIYNRLENCRGIEWQRSQLSSVSKNWTPRGQTYWHEPRKKRSSRAIEELNALGFNYQLTKGAQKAKGKTAKEGAKITKDAPCPICEFKTSPPHDGRTHRNQGKKKNPFTPDELKARGLSRL